MLFNSIDFAIFLPLVFFLYWFVFQKNLRWQNFLIVCASYIFYGWWDWRFLSLIVFSTLVDFVVGLLLKNQNNNTKRKLLLLTSICVNLGFLGFFKYYNFFLDNFVSAFSFLGVSIRAEGLKIILPVGISFYTFQTLSYSIDVYRRKFEPTNNFISFTAFVSFFPQLVAGPIERATNLLPQFYTPRAFDYTKAVDGMRQILWGLFKKIVIADNCARLANIIFNNTDEYAGIVLILGAVFFAFQIYGDFSGYSDIAIGTARLFGFELMQNFAFPYFSRDIAEFWRRWHISLSTWFRDYVYIPLGGSKGNKFTIIRNTFVIFIVSGFWHGANWTFVVWGFLNALYFMPLLLTKRNRKYIEVVACESKLPTLCEFLNILLTFALTLFAWIFFRAENLNHAFLYIEKIIFQSLSREALVDTYNLLYWESGFALIALLLFFLFFEWNGRRNKFAIAITGIKWKRFFRWAFYATIILIIFYYAGEQQEFIYFQF